MNRNKSAEMFGIIGYPLSYSLSPEIHNHFFWKFGLNCTYHIFPTRKEELKHVVAAIRVLGVKGINVTIPFKERIILYLDELDTLAEKVGAVNTVTNHK